MSECRDFVTNYCLQAFLKYGVIYMQKSWVPRFGAMLKSLEIHAQDVHFNLTSEKCAFHFPCRFFAGKLESWLIKFCNELIAIFQMSRYQWWNGLINISAKFLFLSQLFRLLSHDKCCFSFVRLPSAKLIFSYFPFSDHPDILHYFQLSVYPMPIKVTMSTLELDIFASNLISIIIECWFGGIGTMLILAGRKFRWILFRGTHLREEFSTTFP